MRSGRSNLRLKSGRIQGANRTGYRASSKNYNAEAGAFGRKVRVHD